MLKKKGLLVLVLSILLLCGVYNFTTVSAAPKSVATIKVASVSLNKTKYNITVGQTYTLLATINPTNAKNKVVKWTSSNPGIAKIDAKGKITAVSAGTTTITVATVDGNRKATCTITVIKPIIKVSSVSLNKTAATLTVGDIDALVATVNTTNATNKTIVWTSSNPTIATVNNTGKVTAISEGFVTITVTTEDGSKTATCAITVTSQLTAKQIIEKYGNSVVYIEVSDENHQAIASGSGFIVNSNGIVVTNFHVIKGCSYASVTLQNGTKYDVKSVLNYNEKQDIAILQLSNAPNLSIVKLGDSNTLETGDNVVAIGSPRGYENTLSTGIISGINRKSDRGNDIQTTASFTHGSSGGALFDIYGNLIGITYGGYDSAGDLGFVIPINEVKPFLNSTNEKTLIDIKKEMYPTAIPTNLNAWAISNSEIKIQWDSMQNVDGFYVYYSYDLKTWYYFEDESNNKKLLKWYYDYSALLQSIEPNSTVYFKVSAVKGGVEGSQSNVINATTLNEMPSTAIPTNLNAWAISSSEIKIQWDSIQNVDGYYVYYSNDLKTWYYFEDESNNKKLLKWYYDYSALLQSNEPNSIVYFKVSAVKNGIESNLSNISSATTFSSIKGPLTLIADNDKDTYLGKLTSDKYDLDGIFNTYGTYGSKYSLNSIYNTYGTYGSEYSLYSAFNDYTITPPKILNADGVVIGRLTTNKYVIGAVSPNEIYDLLVSLGL